jgi:hypothetical protein
LAVAQNDDLPPLLPTKSGIKQPGLGSKVNKSLHENSFNNNSSQSLNKLPNRSLKRASDTLAQSISINLSTYSKNEEDEDDAYIINQDLEALCKNKTKKIKMDN